MSRSQLAAAFAVAALLAPSAARAGSVRDAAPASGSQEPEGEYYAEPGSEVENLEPTSDATSRDEEAARRRRRRGTFFIGELTLGTTLVGAGGSSIGGLLGVGGKIPGVPLRLYLIGSLRHTQAAQAGGGVDSVPYDNTLSTTDLGLGLRLYIPVVGPFRIMADGVIGSTMLSARSEWAGGGETESSSLPYAEVGVGPQFRILYHLSLGARASWTFVDTTRFNGVGPLTDWENQFAKRTTLLGTVTAHF
jgi:hypothetical protein